PWEQWSVFLHPTQEELVTRDFGGPARVSGSAGTGKTVVAIHRAVHLAEANPHARVLLATFSDQLTSHLEEKLSVLTRVRPRVRERIDVATLVGLAQRLHRARFGEAAKLVTETELERVIEAAANEVGAAFSLPFLLSEWEHVVDAWQLRDWEAYRSVPRIGRKVRLPESARRAAWSVFELVWKTLDGRGATTEAGVYGRLARDEGAAPPYDHVVLDEAQDASAAQLLFLSRLVGDRPNGLFFTGDLGQRIFRQPFSWLAVGVDIRGRSRTLKVNYRTSHQIRTAADRLLDERTDDADGETQERRGTISVFDGPEPTVEVHETEAQERAAVAKWLGAQAEKGVSPNEMAIFVRSEAELGRAAAAAAEAGIPARVLGSSASTASEDRLVIATMHLAKGLEFRSVAVMACDEDVIPSSERLAQAADMVNLQEIHETERHLLYVAITRARDALAVSGVKPGSEFLADLD
ncbi:MAG: UvrD-helicase domain-containing protein, partial [Trueperaceae bacterium]|nr:UvrD-helicase domain-containing protein [Trueperaceae bacterium]